MQFEPCSRLSPALAIRAGYEAVPTASTVSVVVVQKRRRMRRRSRVRRVRLASGSPSSTRSTRPPPGPASRGEAPWSASRTARLTRAPRPPPRRVCPATVPTAPDDCPPTISYSTTHSLHAFIGATRLGEHFQSRTMTISYSKQVKLAHTRLPSVGFPS